MGFRRRAPLVVLAAAVGLIPLASCSGGDRPPPATTLFPVDASTGPTGPLGTAAISLPFGIPAPDPATCDEAASAHSYVGCDYWPIVTANVVWSYFDYAVVLGNTGTAAATVTITGPSSFTETVMVAPGTLQKVVLPWVPNLKGPDEYTATEISASVLEKKGAYHVVSSVPLVAYQFSALEYTKMSDAKNYIESYCPDGPGTACFSYTNDASLLSPSTAWTQSYRVTAFPGQSSGVAPGHGNFLAITASQDGTNVTIALAAKAKVVAGPGIAATVGPGTITEALAAGDVLELLSTTDGADFSGSVVTADKPVQVITGDPCIDIPSTLGACDHIEESIIPAEALGKDYIIAPPVGPHGAAGVQVVRFYGNRDGTTLSYAPKKPVGCPDTLSEGQVADCGTIGTGFIVQGNQEFGVAGFGVGAQYYKANNADGRGDPDQTVFASTLQYRTKYLFLAPDDYEENYAVVTGAKDAAPVIDGAPLSGYAEIQDGYGIWQAPLAPGGTHTLTSTQPVGLQVMGYGAYTSYTYPGGLSLNIISPPPPVK